MMNNMNQMMKQVKKMQEQMMKAQEELGTKMIEGTAGGGVVTVSSTDTKKYKALRLSLKLLIRMMSKCCKISCLLQLMMLWPKQKKLRTKIWANSQAV